MPGTVIHWFRRDLRLHDNPALSAALASGAQVLAVFALDDRILLQPTMGERRLRFLRTALIDLDLALRARGSALMVLRADDVPRELNRLAEEMEAWCIYFNRDYTPYARARDTRVTRGMQMTGVLTQVFEGQLLVEPYATLDEEGEPLPDFEAFHPRWLQALDVAPDPPPVEHGEFRPAATVPTPLPGWEAPWAEQVATASEWPGATEASAEHGCLNSWPRTWLPGAAAHPACRPPSSSGPSRSRRWPAGCWRRPLWRSSCGSRCRR